MSALEIGPKLIRKFGFDIMVHEDCIEFAMEFCENKRAYEPGVTDHDLKKALLTMHQISLVHLDIKPDNIAFSKTFNKWVFLDFGFSDFIDEKLGERTFECFIGTYEYSSPEMKKALTSDTLVDLYYNDMYSLQKSLIYFNQFDEVLVNQASSFTYNYTLSLLLSMEIHQSFVEEILLVSRLKYWLLR